MGIKTNVGLGKKISPRSLGLGIFGGLFIATLVTIGTIIYSKGHDKYLLKKQERNFYKKEIANFVGNKDGILEKSEMPEVYSLIGQNDYHSKFFIGQDEWKKGYENIIQARHYERARVWEGFEKSESLKKVNSLDDL